jgi:hypothetical protein
MPRKPAKTEPPRLYDKVRVRPATRANLDVLCAEKGWTLGEAIERLFNFYRFGKEHPELRADTTSN